MKYTNERVIPDLMKPTNGMLLEHTARYYFSTPYVRGRVLDIACGVGYGTQMIAKNCKSEILEVIGVDLDPESLQYARARYRHPLITYIEADILDPHLPSMLGTFDTILSFETIEHVTDDCLFLNSLYQMLNPGGMLVLSTPFGKGRGIPSGQPYHVHQFTSDEFVAMFSGYEECEVFYQRGVTIEPPRPHVYYPIGVAVCKKNGTPA